MLTIWEAARMKASQFNLLTHDTTTGDLLVFNTASGGLVAIPRELEAEARLALAGDAAGTGEDASGLHQLFADNGLIVDQSLDEVQRVLDRLALGIRDSNRLDVFILPNMNCNFACPYCYEQHRPSQMDIDVEDRLVRWFERTAPLFKVVLVSWFGGEPLLSHDRIVRVQGRVSAICAAAGVECNAHITTNGYLLSPERAADLVGAGVLSYQVTMDGPPEIHNRMRVLKGPGDSFERVFANLCNLVDAHPETNVKLRVNFNLETLPHVPELLERFPIVLRPRLHLVLEKLFGDDLVFIGQSPKKIAQATEAMYGLAGKMGFAITTTPLDPGKLTYCYADRENQFLFTHTGDVFKCTVSTFDPADRLGFLTDNGRVQWEGSAYSEWMAIPAIDEECRSCTYLPMCMGGCRKVRYARGHASSDCTVPFAALDERVRQRYAAERGPDLTSSVPTEPHTRSE